MRQLVVTGIATLDGFVAGPGGDVMVMPFDEGFNVYAAERMRAADHLLLGRTTYAEFRSYWPGVADDPEGVAIRGANYYFSDSDNNRIVKYVVALN